jgi:antitoxin (DNA-binding transcriptional repressor) of toxin-antitoxin stability system
MRVTIAEAATRLPELIAAAQAGEEVIIANDTGPALRLALVAGADTLPPAGNGAALLAFLATLPPGTRTKEEIDADIAALRDDWS